jgi:biopolymer transport protein TolR
MGAALQQRVSKKSGRQRRASPMSEINVTPFVDVMLVLLIIFMVAAPLMATGIKVNLPESNVAQLQEKQEEPVQVIVDKKGDLYIQKTLVPYKELSGKLMSVTKQNKEAHIYIRGDKDANYGDIIKAITAINEAGFSKVGLVTMPKNGE